MKNKKQKPVVVTELEYKIIDFMIKNQEPGNKKIAKALDMDYHQVHNAIYRVVARYGVRTKIELICGIITGKLPPFEQRKYAYAPNRLTKKGNIPRKQVELRITPKKKPVREYTPEELRRMELMRKMGFSEAEIVKEIFS